MTGHQQFACVMQGSGPKKEPGPAEPEEATQSKGILSRAHTVHKQFRENSKFGEKAF
jgi:hypothetical protein